MAREDALGDYAPPCDEAIRIASHVLGDHEGRSIPGVDGDDLAEYVDEVMKAPGTPKENGGTIWWDGEKGAIVILDEKGGGTVYVPDGGYQDFLDMASD